MKVCFSACVCRSVVLGFVGGAVGLGAQWLLA